MIGTMGSTITVNVDVVGEATGNRYVGEFTVKPFLTAKERAEASKVHARLTAGMDKQSVFNTLSFSEFLAERVEDKELAAEIYVKAINCLGANEPMVDFVFAIAQLTQHVVSVQADWWKGDSSIGGYDLPDLAPVDFLFSKILEVQRETRAKAKQSESAV